MRVERLSDLLRDVPEVRDPPTGALTELAALGDTQVLDLWVDVPRSRAGVLLEARQSGAVPAGNAVVLVVTGLRDVRWTPVAAAARVQAFSISGGGVTEVVGGFQLLLQCEPHSDLVAVGSSLSAHFVVVPGLPRAPVDYAADDASILAGTSSWDHEAEVLVSWSLRAGPA